MLTLNTSQQAYLPAFSELLQNKDQIYNTNYGQGDFANLLTQKAQAPHSEELDEMLALQEASNHQTQSVARSVGSTALPQAPQTLIAGIDIQSLPKEIWQNADNNIEIRKLTNEQNNTATNSGIPIGIPLQQQGIEIHTTKAIGLMPTAIALDATSLKTLERAASEPLQVRQSRQMRQSSQNTSTSQNGLDLSVLGSLSSKYESGSKGIEAIGYDRVGGTSYGKYQIASNVGSFDNFLNYLDKQAPDLAEKLNAGGKANTGSTQGKMPEIWRDIAQSEPERFEALQENFIKESHFDPAMNSLKNSGLNTNSDVLQQVVWSTAVQHGVNGAKNIFNSALSKFGAESEIDEKDFISSVYDLRANKFSSSSESIQKSVQNRLIEEKTVALSAL